MKDLKTNKIEHKIECVIDKEKLVTFIEEQIKTKIEGKIYTISSYQYTSTPDTIEFTIISVKEDRLKELTYDVSKK